MGRGMCLNGGRDSRFVAEWAILGAGHMIEGEIRSCGRVDYIRSWGTWVRARSRCMAGWITLGAGSAYAPVGHVGEGKIKVHAWQGKSHIWDIWDFR